MKLLQAEFDHEAFATSLEGLMCLDYCQPHPLLEFEGQDSANRACYRSNTTSMSVQDWRWWRIAGNFQADTS